jgi:hypothetical protein
LPRLSGLRDELGSLLGQTAAEKITTLLAAQSERTGAANDIPRRAQEVEGPPTVGEAP